MGCGSFTGALTTCRPPNDQACERLLDSQPIEMAVQPELIVAASRVRRLEALRYSRLGNLRYEFVHDPLSGDPVSWRAAHNRSANKAAKAPPISRPRHGHRRKRH